MKIAPHLLRRRKSVAVSDALAQALLPIARAHRRSAERVALAWPSVVGPLLAAHSRPDGFDGPLLRVQVRGRDWREILFQQRHELTSRIRALGVRLSGVRLETVPGLPEIEAEVVRIEPIPSDPRTKEITDPGLREAMDALLHAQRVRARDVASGDRDAGPLTSGTTSPTRRPLSNN